MNYLQPGRELNSLPIHEQSVYRSDPGTEFKYGYPRVHQVPYLAAWSLSVCLFPNSLIYIYALIPIKAKWAVLAYVIYELFLGVQNNAGDNVAHWAHLGGGLVGLLLVFYWRKTDRQNFY